jgi:hypothetical protein
MMCHKNIAEMFAGERLMNIDELKDCGATDFLQNDDIFYAVARFKNNDA